MLKRFYSKRSGFTLVEIIVAFAVFAIMASMIGQILDLAIRMRNSNNLYAQELARQERLLTVIEKDRANYNESDATGIYSLNFIDGPTVNLGYQVKATDPAAQNQAEGINYFLSPIDYTCGPAEDEGGLENSDLGGMSQASRMDTRITGTSGIGSVTIYQVVKDEASYPTDPSQPLYLKPGNTRYWIEVAASSKNAEGDTTLRQEDVPYAQYRLFFFSDKLDAAKSAVEYTDADGKTYTKDVYQEAKIVGVGHINNSLEYAKAHGGLDASFTTDGSRKSSNNLYLVQKLASNSVRIGTPFGWDGKIRLDGSKFTRFYIDFEGDPHLTKESFGQNYVDDSGKIVYTACPQYKDEYNTDGTPAYTPVEDSSVHPCIYGAYMYTRHYK